MFAKQKSTVVSTIFFVVFPLLGLALGMYLGDGFASLKREGFGLSWKYLKNSSPFAKIVDANSKNIWAQTSDGRLYYFPFRCNYGDVCNHWIETQAVPDNVHLGFDRPLERGITCPYSSSFKYLRVPPGKLVECVRAITWGMDIVPGWTVYYTLTDGGKIWAWSYTDSMASWPFYILQGSCAGLIVGISAAYLYFRLRRISRKPVTI